MITDAELEAMETKVAFARGIVGGGCAGFDVCEDVPRLVAEVRRLRGLVAAKMPWPSEEIIASDRHGNPIAWKDEGPTGSAAPAGPEPGKLPDHS